MSLNRPDEWWELPEHIRADICHREMIEERNREKDKPFSLRLREFEDEFNKMHQLIIDWPKEDLTPYFKSRADYDALAERFMTRMKYKLTRYRLGIFD